MKLYTEEQMIQAFNYGKTLEPFDCFEDMIKSLTPIELPSDEKIDDETTSSGYGLKEYLAEEEAYTKFIEKLIKKPNNGK